jgi:hypothetical protein
MEELERTVKMPLDPLRIFMQQYGDLAGAGVRHKASSKNNFENTTKQRPPCGGDSNPIKNKIYRL